MLSVILNNTIKMIILTQSIQQTERLGLRNRIEKKASYLQELEDQVRTAINSGFILGFELLCLVYVLKFATVL